VQQYSIEHRALDYMSARHSLIPSFGLEERRIRVSWLDRLGDQKWNPDCYLDITQPSRRSRLPDRKIASPRRVCFFPSGTGDSIPCFIVAAKIRACLRDYTRRNLVDNEPVWCANYEFKSQKAVHEPGDSPKYAI